MHLVVFGGGAALAQPIIRSYLADGWNVTAICKDTTVGEVDYSVQPKLEVLNDIDLTGLLERLPKLEPIDLVAMCQGSHEDSKLENMSWSSWRRVIDDCLSSVYNALRWSFPSLKDGSNVVVLGSIIGSTGAYGAANYAAAKAGLVGLVRSFSQEMASRGICVNLLELGYIDSGMGRRLPEKVREKVTATIPLKKFGTEEEVVRAVEFLGRTKYMTGNVLTLAGGLR